MKVLVIGGGGREHALVWKIRQSPRVSRVYCAPGNAGIGELAELVPLTPDDVPGLRSFDEPERSELIVVEEVLHGEEASFLAVTDGYTGLPLASAQDHKRAFDGDRGPNTGGMGAYSPAPLITPALADRIVQEIMLPAIKGLSQRKI